MNTKIRQDLIDFNEIIAKARAKITECSVSGVYGEQLLLEVDNRLALAMSAFSSMIFHSVNFNEFKEMMTSIEKRD